MSALPDEASPDGLGVCDGPSPVNLDGELRVAKEVEMRIAPEKVNFFFPRGLSWAVDAADTEAKMTVGQERAY